MSKKRKTLLSDEVKLLNCYRVAHSLKPYDERDMLSRNDMILINEKRKIESIEKFKLGYKVVQTEDWFNTKSGRVGWVTSIWPRTKVLFEDGAEPDIHVEFSRILIPVIDDYKEDIETLREQILNKTEKSRTLKKAKF